MQRSSIRGFKILVRRTETKIKHGSALVIGEVDRRSVKRWWTTEKVSILFETRSSTKTSVPMSHSSSFKKSLFWKRSCQSCMARQCTVTEGLHQIFIMLETERNWDSASRSGARRIQHYNRHICRILYRCGPDGWWTGLKEYLLRLIKKQESRL